MSFTLVVNDFNYRAKEWRSYQSVAYKLVPVTLRTKLTLLTYRYSSKAQQRKLRYLLLSRVARMYVGWTVSCLQFNIHL